MAQVVQGTIDSDGLTGTSPGTPGNVDGIDLMFGFDGDDVIQGLDGNDTIDGGTGADYMDGGNGRDTLSYANASAGVGATISGFGWAGEADGDEALGFEVLVGSDFNDNLLGSNGDDTIDGGLGDDYMQLTDGADQLDGGDGMDEISAAGSTVGVDISLTTGLGFGGLAENKIFTNFEIVTGSSFDDIILGVDNVDVRLFGGAGVDNLIGYSGDDRLTGGVDSDTLNGGTGSDTALYAGSTAAVRVSLVTNRGQGGDAAGDALISIENLHGSSFNDALVGNSGNNTLAGQDGNDLLMGGAGADYLDGGDGTDTVSYRDGTVGVLVDLALGTASLGDAQGDTLVSIENLMGSDFFDVFVGDDGANRLDGRGGSDTLQAGGGNDTLLGQDGDDGLAGEDGADRLLGGDGNDVLLGGAGIDQLYGGAGADAFGFYDLVGGVDRIRDWETGDNIVLLKAGLGIEETVTVVNGTSTAGLEGDLLFYHTGNGRLYFHEGDTGDLSLFALITNKPASLSLSDFTLI